MVNRSILAVTSVLALVCGGGRGYATQEPAQEARILEAGDKLLEEAKATYEEARNKSAVALFVDAGFKLEEARIKFLVLQEIGTPEKQKLASDRLRAMNQLSKLLHDGKAAISGSPASSTPPKPEDAPAAQATPDAPSPPPAKDAPYIDVSKRSAAPEIAKQKDAEKTIKELFKDQYSKKGVADRKALSVLLLNQVAKSQDDLPALWVLWREAQDVSIQICDIKTLLQAIEAEARVFDIDSLSVKSAALTSAGKNAKLPDEFVSVVDALHGLLEELVRSDQYDVADKTANTAIQYAKKTNDSAVVNRAVLKGKEVSEAKTIFQSMKSVMETMAKRPNDPTANLEIGRFLCFVKGTWDLGLRFMAKGSDAGMKTLSEQELASPAQAADRAALADSWSALADKEKSPLRKSQLQIHARSIYESALPDATSLLRAKIEKKLIELSAVAVSGGGKTDLLSLIDPAKDQVSGIWTLTNRRLGSPNTPKARLEIPYVPPSEYDLRIVLERAGPDLFHIGLSNGTKCISVKLDYNGSTESSLGTARYNGAAIPQSKPTVIVCQVRKTTVKVLINDSMILDSAASIDSLGMDPNWKTPSGKALCIGSHNTVFHISEMTLISISGQGQKLR